LTALSSNEGTLSLTVNIDKSTAKKAAWWVIAGFVALFLVLGAVVFFLGKVSAALDASAAETSRALSANAAVMAREARLTQQAIDERRLENRAAWRELGIDGYALEDHDISKLLDQVREKHPVKETRNEP
jgi:hypothetical protein